MAKIQHYGIKFPFSAASEENTLFDLSLTKAESVQSQIMHVIFTPKGQRLRNPDFGTSLIQYIFNPNDKQTWADVVSEIKSAVSAYVPDCNLTNIEIREGENGYDLYAKINYTVSEGGYLTDYETITKL